jgi:GNAT superfamily N-acetyltransferase
MGQQPPPRPGTKRAEEPRAATIHEYLDWTVNASEPEDPDELDFGGFRVLILMPRFKLQWPPPSAPYNSDQPLVHSQLGAPLPPIPHILVHHKPISAATVRIGPGWLEVPFYATQETRRNRGNGRALLEAIEDICRMLKIPRILLCSTDDPRVKNTWRRLGFHFTTKDDLDKMGVTRHDLLHMDNTVQMHKDVPPRAPWRPISLVHGDMKQRLYYMPGGGGVPPVPDEVMNMNTTRPMPGGKLLGGGSAAKKTAANPPKKRKR